MADLGTISFTDVNAGTSRVDRSGEAAAIEQALRVGKTVVDESIKGSVTKDMNEAVAGAESDQPGQAITQEAQQQGENLAVYPEGSREAHLSSTVDRLNNVIEQGNTSQVQLAQMRVKKILSEAQSSYPWLYEDLQARAGSVMSGSVQLEQLAMEDAARTDAASAATKQVQAIVDHAQNTWKNGGLGIDPSLQPSDPAFVAQYSDRQKLRETSERASRISGMMVANSELDASVVYDEYSALLTGNYSLARAEVQATFDDHGVNAMLSELQKGPAANMSMIQEVQNVGIPNAIAELEQKKLELQTLYSDLITPRMAGTQYFEDLNKRQTDTVAQMDSMISQLKVIATEIPDTPTLIRESMAIRAYDFGRTMPEPFQTFMAWAATPGGEQLIRIAGESKTAAGITTLDHLSGLGVSALGQMYPGLYGASPSPESQRLLAYTTGSSYEITPTTPSRDINKAIDARARDSENPWIVPTAGANQELDAATKSLLNWDSLYANGSVDIPDNAGEQFAGEFLTGLNTTFRTYNTIPDRPDDVQELSLEMLAGNNVGLALDIAGDGASRNQRMAFGASAKEWYVDTNPQARRAEVQNVYTTKHIDRTPLHELATVNLDRMSQGGEFVYAINEEKVRKLASARVGAEFGSRVATTLPKQIESIRQEIITTMDPLAAEVMQQIAIEQNLMRANAPASDNRPRSEVNLEYYTGDNDPGQQLPWIDVFRHSGN